jgi:hypothetical protein
MLFVCPLCGFALVEAPSKSTNRANFSPRIALAFALVTTISVVFYIAMQLSYFEHQPTRTSKLATTVERAGGHIDGVQTHHLF